MFPNYHMFFINITLLLILGLSLFFYNKIYPKRRINYFIVLILISLLPTISIWREGAYESGDFSLHLYRAIDYFNALKGGQLLPSWAPMLNSTYGYSLFIFLNPLPYVAISLLHFIGITFIASMKLYLAGAYVLSGIGMYLFAGKLLKSSYAAFATAISYLFFPYHLLDLHFRVAIGEITLFATLPFLLYSIVLLLEKRSIRNICLTALTFSLTVFSHQALLLFTMLLATSLSLFLSFQNKKRGKFLTSLFVATLVGLLISAYSLFPFVYFGEILSKSTGSYTISFSNVSDLIASPYRYGFLYQGPIGQLSVALGYIQWSVVIIAVFLIFRTKNAQRKKLIFWLSLLFIFLFLMLPQSNFFWNLFPIVKMAAISSRMLLFASVCLSIIAGLIALRVNRLFSLFLIALLILTSILNWGNRQTIPEINDEHLIKNLPLSTVKEEGWGNAITKWQTTKKFESNIPERGYEIIGGTAEVVNYKRSSSTHEYAIFATAPTTFKDNTWYFPGWKAMLNGKPQKITFENNPNGHIIVEVPKGIHKLSVFYGDVLPLRFVKILSVSVLLVSVCVIFGSLLTRKLKLDN